MAMRILLLLARLDGEESRCIFLWPTDIKSNRPIRGENDDGLPDLDARSGGGIFSRLRIKMATGLGSGVEESGDSTEDLLFDWRGKRGVAGNERLPL